MIFIGDNNFPVESRGDGGDSAVRAGLLTLCNHAQSKSIDLKAYEKMPGFFCRHPIQYPWDNVHNYSRDQASCFMAGLTRLSRDSWFPDDKKTYQKMIERYFYARMKSFFFCQNFERDRPGSTKYPWKHTFINDKNKVETRAFDFADPMFPNHIGALILGARLYAFYILVPFCLLVHILLLLIHSKTSDFEENQMIGECSVYRTLWIYKRVHKKWKEISHKYWSERGEVEYHYMLVDLVEGK